jgi:hypothetical protein
VRYLEPLRQLKARAGCCSLVARAEQRLVLALTWIIMARPDVEWFSPVPPRCSKEVSGLGKRVRNRAFLVPRNATRRCFKGLAAATSTAKHHFPRNFKPRYFLFFPGQLSGLVGHAHFRGRRGQSERESLPCVLVGNDPSSRGLHEDTDARAAVCVCDGTQRKVGAPSF